MSIMLVSSNDALEAVPASGQSPAPPAARSSIELEDPRLRRFAGARRWQAPAWTRRFAGPLVLLIFWQIVAGFHLVDHRTLVPPSAVLAAAVQLFADGELQRHFAASLQRVAWGLSIGVAIGLALSVIAGFFRLGRDIVDSSMNMLRMVPVIALLPLIIVWMGIGEPAKISLIIIGTIFPIYMNTYSAIRGVDQKLVEAGRAFGLGHGGLIGSVILPGALPGFLVGLRWALGSAWLLLFFAEQINADTGIGFLVNQAQAWNRTDIILLGIAIYGFLGLAGDVLVRLLERWLLRWRKGFEGA
jgi:sulfonate transport system permease protein